MIKNYFKVAWRNLWKNKSFSLINILGLATGLACFILISLYVVDELSYDRYNKKADRIYRVNTDLVFGGATMTMAATSDPMGETLKKDYPQVEQYTRIYRNGSVDIKKGDVYINEKNMAHVDSTFFDMFSLPALYGDTKTALNEPNTVVLTETAARKYFDRPDVMGETIETGKGTLYKITAVIKDIPENSHFHFDFLFSMDNVRYQWGNYLSFNFITYILLKKGVDYSAFSKKINTDIINKYALPQVKEYMQINSMDEFTKAGNRLEFSLVPLTDIHLHSDRTGELGVNGNIQYVYIFSAVALFILFIACINFMNLSTARSSNRAKEVGIRKVLGSEKGKLVGQFLVESITVALISTLLALLIAYLLLPYYNDLAGKSITLIPLFKNRLLPGLILLPLLVGLIAGSYPAFYLSKFQPLTVLKGKLSVRSKKSFVRNALVVFQFATCIILIVGTLVVYGQLHYIQNKKLGFNKDQVLVVSGTGALGKNMQPFKNEVLNMPGVVNGTLSAYLPVPSSRTDYSFSKEAVMNSQNGFNMQVWQVDENYIPVFGMEMQKGRNFSKEFRGDSASLIINETLAKNLGYDDPVGKTIYSKDFSNSDEVAPFKIIGVVKNFHFESLKDNIGPLALALEYSPYAASFRINTANAEGLIKKIESKWSALAPGHAFSYYFLDDSFNNMYRAEQRVGKIAFTFAILAILIACLGLFGLVTYMAEQRTKEIGIRKILGANTGAVVQLLSRDFLLLVLMAFVIAAPLAWWAMHKWLQDFAYRTNINWWIFVAGRNDCLINCFADHQLSGNQSSYCKPCKKFENRIKVSAMIKNYFKTAFRNLARNKVYSFINIAGLSHWACMCHVYYAVCKR